MATQNPHTVDGIFQDLSQRRKGLIRALTQDVDKFYNQCDPNQDNLCLYGQQDGTWEVALPVEEVPPELPEPALGINFARDGMQRKDWLKLVAVHSDAWLLAVAFFYGAKLNKQHREQLFKQINSRPTVFETLVGAKEGGSAKTGPPAKTSNKKRPAEREPVRYSEKDLENDVLSLKGKKFTVVWEDGQMYTGVVKSVNKAKRTLHLMYDSDDPAEISYDPDLPLDGPDGFLEGGYTIID
mmetsp:Transcript_1145/g.2380  ORF Transcript_1145/g.2380 Transcript_1145/m.2380 type:complete len:240 (+) Transcript_1145:93-812(+)|eukprot:CAMPEP_0114245910 /NCGR_PEP_ID=MMETSP0058-20121206/12164_1 /TAXON_ID=36894 /ORGANISM="Pyramimonas parkeae, CCMP726" /LENGTH=239 /DNA_ID=CAMNT_0001359027 /DNA_START=76 /DNA_END=795 /DNA_ORIENTATION=+